jgi:hypothetical protein
MFRSYLIIFLLDFHHVIREIEIESVITTFINSFLSIVEEDLI